MSQADLEILMKVVVAICLGGLIGIEREIVHKPAGIRTHMFVAGAAALVIAISDVLIKEFNSGGSSVQSDPVRVIEAITVGISFIGAGTVLKSEGTGKVYYLTTAASILFAAYIGVTVGLEKIGLAIALTLLVILINAAVGGIEQRVFRKSNKESDDVHSQN